MSGDLGSCGTSEWGMVENVGVAAEIALPSFSVQKLFLLSVCIIAILRFPCRPTSAHVVSCISESGMVENVGVALDISLLSHASPEIQCTSGLSAAILFSGCRRMSVNVDDAAVELGMVENMGVSNYAHLFENGRFSSFFPVFPV